MSRAPDWKELERKLDAAVKVSSRPVAVCFLNAVPDGVQKLDHIEPSGCSFWRIAADGRTFYTLPEDHANCAVGAHTHNLPLPPARADETEQTLTMMFDLGYLKPEEVPQVPQLSTRPAAIVYAPLGETPVAPDVVLTVCKPASAMLLNEAAHRAGVASGGRVLGRPTCMALPASMQHGATVSLGCIGNRVYTDLGEDELYFVLPGRDLQVVVDALAVVSTANTALYDYARGRRLRLRAM
jgi:uncharacterized protein (DUF169 family)